MFRTIGFAAALSASAVGAALLTGAAPVALAAETARHGAFEGRSDHVVTGGVTIERVGGGIVVTLSPDFSLDGAPAPTPGFARDGAIDEASLFAPLKALTGALTYTLPADLDPDGYDAFVVWCADFSVPPGYAALD